MNMHLISDAKDVHGARSPKPRKPRFSLPLVLASLAALAACDRSSVLASLPADASSNAQRYAQECDDGTASSCYALGWLFALGDESGHGIQEDIQLAQELMNRACAGGHEPGCEAAETLQSGEPLGPDNAVPGAMPEADLSPPPEGTEE